MSHIISMLVMGLFVQDLRNGSFIMAYAVMTYISFNIAIILNVAYDQVGCVFFAFVEFVMAILSAYHLRSYYRVILPITFSVLCIFNIYTYASWSYGYMFKHYFEINTILICCQCAILTWKQKFNIHHLIPLFMGITAYVIFKKFLGGSEDIGLGLSQFLIWLEEQ